MTFIKRTAERNPAPEVERGETEHSLRERTRRPDGGYFPPIGGYSLRGPNGAFHHYEPGPWER